MSSEHLTTDTIIDFLHGELRPQDDAAVHAHLATCTACRAEIDAEAALGDALRAAAARDEAEFPSLVAAQVWETIRNARPSPLAGLGAIFRPALALPALAVLVIGTLFAAPSLQQAGTRPSIDAGYYFADHAAQAAEIPFSDQSAPAETIETSALESDQPPPTTALAEIAAGEPGIVAAAFDGGR
jgi:anti-sigma factor RsiW